MAEETTASRGREGQQKTQDLTQALRQAAAKLAEQLSDASSLVVSTRWIEVGEDDPTDFTKAKLAAYTEIALDGDTTLVIPMRRESGVLVRDDALLEHHLNSVKNAIEYRQRLLDAMFDLAKQVRSR